MRNGGSFCKREPEKSGGWSRLGRWLRFLGLELQLFVRKEECMTSSASKGLLPRHAAPSLTYAMCPWLLACFQIIDQRLPGFLKKGSLLMQERCQLYIYIFFFFLPDCFEIVYCIANLANEQLMLKSEMLG